MKRAGQLLQAVINAVTQSRFPGKTVGVNPKHLPGLFTPTVRYRVASDRMKRNGLR